MPQCLTAVVGLYGTDVPTRISFAAAKMQLRASLSVLGVARLVRTLVCTLCVRARACLVCVPCACVCGLWCARVRTSVWLGTQPSY